MRELRGRRSAYSFEREAAQSVVEKMISEYGAISYALRDRLGAMPPPIDPYRLLVLADASGYHAQAMRWRKAGTTGQGFTASDKLMAHLKMANEHETFQNYLNCWADDLEHFGNAYTHIVKGPVTVNFYRRASVKVRVKPPGVSAPSGIASPLAGTAAALANTGMQFIYYEYIAGTGLAAYIYYDRYLPGMAEGVSHCKLHSRSGNLFYGDPDYTSTLKLLGLNVEIVDLAQKWFENSMITDMAMVLKGAELDPEEKQNIRAYLRDNMKGATNAYKVLFLEVGANEEVQFEKLGTGFNDTLFIKVRDSIREEQAAGDGIPGQLAGIDTHTMSIGDAQGSAQLRQFKLGWADMRRLEMSAYWQQVFSDCGLPDPESFEINEFDTTAGEDNSKYYSQMVGAGIFTADEARQQLEEKRNTDALIRMLSTIKKGFGYADDN